MLDNIEDVKVRQSDTRTYNVLITAKTMSDTPVSVTLAIGE